VFSIGRSSRRSCKRTYVLRRYGASCSGTASTDRTRRCTASPLSSSVSAGGVFRVLTPDNTKAIVAKADPLEPLLSQGFLEYAQARGFFIDSARVRKATDKARVERTVRDVRDDCFGSKEIVTLDQARDRALVWCRDEYGTPSLHDGSTAPRALGG
jgi:transposase